MFTCNSLPRSEPSALSPLTIDHSSHTAGRRFHIFTIFTLIMPQATLIAPHCGSGPLTAITWLAGAGAGGSFYFPSRYDCCHIYFTYSLLLLRFLRSFYFTVSLFLSYFWFFCHLPFAISVGHKQSRQKKSVAWRHNELKFIGSFGKIREIYSGSSFCTCTRYGHSLFCFYHLARNFNIEQTHQRPKGRLDTGNW